MRIFKSVFKPFWPAPDFQCQIIEKIAREFSFDVKLFINVWVIVVIVFNHFQTANSLKRKQKQNI